MTDKTAALRLNKASLLVRSQPLFTPRVLDTIEDLARNAGLDRNDFAELMVLSEIGDILAREFSDSADAATEPNDARDTIAGESMRAKWILDRFLTGNALAVPRTDRRRQRIYADGLPANYPRAVIEDVNVLALRMAHSQELHELDPEPGGYPRSGLGMDLTSPAEELWEHSRGYWRVRPDADYILPTRHGYAPYLFKVAGWRTASNATNPSDRTAKYWAQSGWVVDSVNNRLISLDGGTERTPSPTDLALGELLAGQAIRYPLGIRNPAVWLGRR